MLVRDTNKLERITLEESEMYIPITDLEKETARYFTLIPDTERGEGWERVTYFLGRKKKSFSKQRDLDDNAFIYIFSNKSMPGYLKIGFTSLSIVEERGKQLDTTGVALPFDEEFAYSYFEPGHQTLEKKVHDALDSYRARNSREFFTVDLQTAIETIVELGKEYK